MVLNIILILSKILTFPGAMIRGFWEQIYCKTHKVPVENNKYLRLNEMCGHIEHEQMPTKSKTFSYCFFPGIMVFITGLIFFVPSFINLWYLDIQDQALKTIFYILLYLAFSMFTNIFPTIEDALYMWDNYKKRSLVGKIFFAPASAIMYIGSYAEAYAITFLTNILCVLAILMT